jgi:predicted small lipoprotein YifL
MKRLIALSALALLAACGADGEPQAPSASSTVPGVTISGDAQIGIVSN